MRYLVSMIATARFLFFIFSLVFVTNAFSQKVLIIKSPIKGLDKSVLTTVDISKFKDSFQFWDWQTERGLTRQADGSYIISTYADCIRLSRGEDYAKGHLETPPTEYSTFFINHIRSYHSDTIVISGLAFSSYNSRKLIRSDYIEYSDSMEAIKRKNIVSAKTVPRTLTKTLPYPKIMANGKNMRRCLKLIRTKPISYSHAHGNNPTFYIHRYYDACDFWFVLDLSSRIL